MRALVARLDSMGDVLLSGPAVRAVAASGADVTFLSGPRGRAAAELLPGVARVETYCAPWIDPEPPELHRHDVDALVDRLGALALDQALILTSFHQSPLPLALVLRMAGVPVVAATCEDYPGSLLDVRHRVPDDIHEVERALSLASALGHRLPPGDDGGLAIRDCAAAGALESRQLPRGDYVVVHPGASVPARAWSADRHAALVRNLTERGWPVVLTGSESETGLCRSVAARAPGAVTDLSGALELPRLADVLAGAAVVVAANTGPAHLAAAVRTPVVSLFAPTVPAVRWRPWNVPHALLGAQDVPCAGCRSRTCPVPGHPCLSSVTPEEVEGAIERLAPASARPVVGAPS